LVLRDREQWTFLPAPDAFADQAAKRSYTGRRTLVVLEAPHFIMDDLGAFEKMRGGREQISPAGPR